MGENMNKKQKTVCWVAGIVFFLTTLDAPWSRTTSYGFTSGISAPIWGDAPYNSTLQIGQLGAEWVAIAAGAGFLLFVLKSKTK